MRRSILDRHPLFKDYLRTGSTVMECGYPWDRLDVTNTGEALPCCFAQETLGNVLQLGLDGVLNGPRRRALQEDVSAGRLHPLCFNAPCPFARNTMRRGWETFFPADRFLPRLGEMEGSTIAYSPSRGDGLIFAGPDRFFPEAAMEARFVFAARGTFGPGRTVNALATGVLILEAGDTTGQVFARGEVPISEIETAAPVRFQIEGYHRRRCEFRAHARGVNVSLLFSGIRLSGAPADHKIATRSISTRTFLGRRETSTVERAGGCETK